MSKKPESKQTLAEASITLPEGAVLTLTKYNGHCEIHAYREGNELRMRVDNISAQQVGTYLQMFAGEIARRRALLTEKPTFVPNSLKPKDMDTFVKHMAVQGMFIFDAIIPEVVDDTTLKKKPRKSAKKKSVDLETITEIFPNATVVK